MKEHILKNNSFCWKYLQVQLFETPKEREHSQQEEQI
jgi:hypothetical protein